MMTQTLSTTLLRDRDWARAELDACVRFWLEHGMDPEHGGVYTCLDREGAVYSTDKSVWMQGRCAWMFSHLCAVYGVRSDWLEAAKSCLNFLEAHCVNHQKDGRLYFTVTADGKPLRQRRYNFSEGFYCMANAEYALLTGEREPLERAREAFSMIWGLNHGLLSDPVNMGPKTDPDTRPGRALADPMISLNLCAVLRRCDPERTALYDERARQCVGDILTYHRKPELRCTLETTGPHGEFYGDVTAGRVVNPGHDIECSWFMMEASRFLGDKALFDAALSMFDDAFEAGWDTRYGGLLYFVDCLKKPTEAYEHDMKLWWPHCEILIASLKAYQMGGGDKYLDVFHQTLDYCKQVFSDPEYGEWYGYLRRDGKPTEPATKGSTFKGPFHLPRMLVQVDQMLLDILNAK